jgi:membrane fusion protein (multidrug efflux system)
MYGKEAPMNPLSRIFVERFAEFLTTVLINSVWQGAVLMLILLVAVKLLGVKTARLRYILSVGTLLMLGIVPIVTATVHHQRKSRPQHSPVEIPGEISAEISGQPNPAIEEHAPRSADNTTSRVVADVQNAAASPWNPGIETYVLMAWLAGVLILSTRLAIGFGITLWIRVNIKPLSEEFEQRVRILGDRLGVDARDRVFVCVKIGQAVAVGFIRPVVLIPAPWLTQFTPEMIEAVLAHELAHIRRWDLWVNVVQRIIETLLFYHPAVWWLSSRIRLEREMCCDEIAAQCSDRVSYARSLESVATMGQGDLLLATLFNGGSKMNLLKRIRNVLGLAPADAAVNWWAVGFMAIILPFSAAIAFSLVPGAAPAAAPADGKSAESKAIEKIAVASVQAKAVTINEQYVCEIRAHRHIEVRASAKGHLDTVPIREGREVKEGDLMFAVNPLLYQSKLDAENAETRLAQLEYNHTKKLSEDKVVSQEEVALAEAKLAKATAKVRSATGELELASVKAPFDGIVGRLQHQRGSLVREGDVLTTLSDNSALWVYFNVPEARYLEYMTDQQHKDDLQIELILANGKKFNQAGKINAIEADFNNATGTISFRADFPNPDRLLRHGQSGTVLISRVLKDAIVVPRRATFEVLQKQYVYVVDKENVAHLREITTQNESEDLFVIKKGVGVDDKIVIKGIKQVHDGEKVEFDDRAH